MKKGVFILLAITLAAFITLPALADQKGHGRNYRQPTKDRRDNPGKTQGYDNRDRDRDYDYRKPEHRPRGYRKNPNGRHYTKPHKRRGHEYHYDGHWNSYDANTSDSLFSPTIIMGRPLMGDPSCFAAATSWQQKGALYLLTGE